MYAHVIGKISLQFLSKDLALFFYKSQWESYKLTAAVTLRFNKTHNQE